MAPRLAAAQHLMIDDMIHSGTLTQIQMAAAIRCSERGIQRIARNLRHFGTTKARPKHDQTALADDKDELLLRCS